MNEAFYFFFMFAGIIIFFLAVIFMTFRIILSKRYQFYIKEFEKLIGNLATGAVIQIYAPEDDSSLRSIRLYRDDVFLYSYDARDSKILLAWLDTVNIVKEDNNIIRLSAE